MGWIIKIIFLGLAVSFCSEPTKKPSSSRSKKVDVSQAHVQDGMDGEAYYPDQQDQTGIGSPSDYVPSVTLNGETQGEVQSPKEEEEKANPVPEEESSAETSSQGTVPEESGFSLSTIESTKRERCVQNNSFLEYKLYWHPDHPNEKDRKIRDNEGICSYKEENEYYCNSEEKYWHPYDEKYAAHKDNKEIRKDNGVCDAITPAQYECENNPGYVSRKYAWQRLKRICMAPDISVEEDQCINGPTPFADDPNNPRTSNLSLGFYYKDPQGGSPRCYSSIEAAVCVNEKGYKFENGRCFQTKEIYDCEADANLKKIWLEASEKIPVSYCASIDEFVCKVASEKLWEDDPLDDGHEIKSKMCFDSEDHKTCRAQKLNWTGSSCVEAKLATDYCKDTGGSWDNQKELCKPKEQVACESRNPIHEWFLDRKGNFRCLVLGAKDCLNPLDSNKGSKFWWQSQDKMSSQCFDSEDQLFVKECTAGGKAIYQDPIDPTKKLCVLPREKAQLECSGVWYQSEGDSESVCHTITEVNLNEAKKACLAVPQQEWYAGVAGDLAKPPRCIPAREVWEKKCKNEKAFTDAKMFFSVLNSSTAESNPGLYECRTALEKCKMVDQKFSSYAKLDPPAPSPKEINSATDPFQCVTEAEYNKLVCEEDGSSIWTALDYSQRNDPAQYSCIRKLKFVYLSSEAYEPVVDTKGCRHNSSDHTVFTVKNIPRYGDSMTLGEGKKIYCPIGQTIAQGKKDSATPYGIPAFECGVIGQGNTNTRTLGSIEIYTSGAGSQKREIFKKLSESKHNNDDHDSGCDNDMSMVSPKIDDDNEDGAYYCFGNYFTKRTERTIGDGRYYCVDKRYILQRDISVSQGGAPAVYNNVSGGNAVTKTHFQLHDCHENCFAGSLTRHHHDTDYDLIRGKNFNSYGIPGLFFWYVSGHEDDPNGRSANKMYIRPDLVNFTYDGGKVSVINPLNDTRKKAVDPALDP